jgi:hypothetical protein
MLTRRKQTNADLPAAAVTSSAPLAAKPTPLDWVSNDPSPCFLSDLHFVFLRYGFYSRSVHVEFLIAAAHRRSTLIYDTFSLGHADIRSRLYLMLCVVSLLAAIYS